MIKRTSDFFFVKLAALLHDPPNKAWCLVKKKNHKNVASSFINQIFSGHQFLVKIHQGIREYLWGSDGYRLVARSDIFSSSVDRWILNHLLVIDDKYVSGAFPVNEIKIKHILDPSIEVSPQIFREPNNEKAAKKLQDTLNNLLKLIAKNLNELNDEIIRLLYHLFYAIFELCWHEINPLSTSPADTRVPIHSIFDHLYATATATNLFAETIEKPTGYLIRLDLAGVHSFISMSRRVRDIWISSWLASALAWGIIWNLVRVLGPDILIKPTARFNPFYYYSLYGWLVEVLSKNGLNYDEIKKQLKELLKLFEKIWGGEIDQYPFPRHPVIPSTIDLILPSLNTINSIYNKTYNSIDEFIKEEIIGRYLEMWKNIINTVISELKQELHVKQDLELLNSLEKCIKLGVEFSPPLPIRVIIVDFEKISKNLVHDYEIYEKAFSELNKETQKASAIKITSNIIINYTTYTNDFWLGEKLDPSKHPIYKICSLCGISPAIFESYANRTVPGKLSIYFSDRERLCAIDLIKRLITISRITERVIRNVCNLEYCKEHIEFYVPSLSDIAGISFITSIIKTNLKRTEASSKFLEVMDSFLSESIQFSKNYIETLRSVINNIARITPRPGLIYDAFLRLSSEIDKRELDERHKENIFFFLLCPVEEFKELLRETRYAIKKFITFVRDNKIEPPRLYYALITGDGDYIGDLFNGLIEEATNGSVTVQDYILNMCKGKIRELLHAIIHDQTDRFFEIYQNELKRLGEQIPKNKIRQVAQKIKEILITQFRKKSIPISLTYHVALSRALMIQSLVDSKIADQYDGFVVYAGGDDVFILAPTNTMFKILLNSRFTYSLGRLYDQSNQIQDGFYDPIVTGFKIVIPALYHCGRSYGIAIAHYKYPFKSTINYADIALNNCSKKTEVNLRNRTRKKDSCTILFIARGGKILKSTIPNLLEDTIGINLPAMLKFLLECPQYYSKSLIYDMLTDLPRFIILGNKDPNLAKELIKHTLARNKLNSHYIEAILNRHAELLSSLFSTTIKMNIETFNLFDQIIYLMKIYEDSKRGRLL